MLGRALQVLSLSLVFVTLFVTSSITPAFEGPFGVIAALGFLLLAGMLAADLAEMIALPHLTAYLAVGIVAGPHVLHLVDHAAVTELQSVNVLALALIALAGGTELRLELLRPLLRSLSIATVVHSVIGTLGISACFLAAAPYLPFTASETLFVQLGIAALWGVLGVSRSPSALLAVLAQTRADGPLTRYSLGFVMSSDIVVAVLMTLTISLVHPLVEPGSNFSLRNLQELGHELLGSIALGSSVGIVLAIYLRLVQGRLLLVLVALGFGLTEGLRYLHFDPLLTFIVAGFVVANTSQQGPKLLHAIEQTSGIVFVVFFATAGAHLDLPLVTKLWPFAVGLTAARALLTLLSHGIASRIAKDEPVVRRWGAASLVSQAGLTLGLSAVVERSFPSFGPSFRALVIATVAINEVVGPVLWKLALDRSGETGKGHLHEPLA